MLLEKILVLEGKRCCLRIPLVTLALMFTKKMKLPDDDLCIPPCCSFDVEEFADPGTALLQAWLHSVG